MIWINFKTYQAATGEGSLKLAKICLKISQETGVKIWPVCQVADIFRLSQSVDLEVWTQHVDDIDFGSNTGWLLPEAVQAAGASGTILNHSENKLPYEVIQATLKRAKELGMKTMVCCESVEEAREIADYQPDFLAYEPPELIGSKNKSVATAKPELVADFIEGIEIGKVIGAGISSRKDIELGLELGVQGFLVASAVVLADDPEEKLRELAEGFNKKGAG